MRLADVLLHFCAPNIDSYLEDVPVFESIAELKWNDNDNNHWLYGTAENIHWFDSQDGGWLEWWTVTPNDDDELSHVSTPAFFFSCTLYTALVIWQVDKYYFSNVAELRCDSKKLIKMLCSCICQPIKMFMQGIDNSQHSSQRPQSLMLTVLYIFPILAVNECKVNSMGMGSKRCWKCGKFIFRYFMWLCPLQSTQNTINWDVEFRMRPAWISFMRTSATCHCICITYYGFDGPEFAEGSPHNLSHKIGNDEVTIVSLLALLIWTEKHNCLQHNATN